MKNNLLYILGIVFVICICPNVYASNGVVFDMRCPSSISLQKTSSCDLYATISGENATFSSVRVSGEDTIGGVSTDISDGKEIKAGSKRFLGKIIFKSANTSGLGRVKFSANIRFSDGEPLIKYNASASKAINVISSVNTLSAIRVDGILVSGFNKNITNYYVSSTKDKVSVDASRSSVRSTVTGVGVKNLKCGNNNIVLSVKAENGALKKYSVVINRKCSDNAYLKNIVLSSGELSPAFKEDVYNYNVKLDNKVDNKVDKITIKGEKGDTNQIISGEVVNKKIGYGKTTVSLVVTSQTGSKKTYTINFEKKDNRDDNSLLASLSINNGNINFDKNVFEYETKVLNSVTNIEVLAVAEKKSSLVKIVGNNNLKVGDNLISIVVTSENNKVSEYKIKVNRLKPGETLGDNANIKNIVISGYDFPFNYNKTKYKLVIANEDRLDINITMDDSSAIYEITGNDRLEDGDVIKIVTKSLDGTSKTYTIEITKNSYFIYYVIFAVLVTLAVSIPVFVYFKSVKKRRENLDVNGYKVGKPYDEKDYSRKVIGGKKKSTTENKKNNVPAIKIVSSSKDNSNVSNKVNKLNEDVTGDSDTPSSTDLFDEGLSDYVPDGAFKCPHCKRELLGKPNKCPYCKKIIK